MKTKAMGFLSMLFMVLALNVVFTSCSDDDDKTGTSALVGTWKYSDKYGYTLLTLNADGSGVYIEKSYTYDEDEYSPFRYTYTSNGANGGVLILMYYGGYDNETETWIVNSIAKDMLVLDGDVYNRVK